MNEEILKVLNDIHRCQKQQLEMQEQALELQRNSFEFSRQQQERINRIQDRAERLQESSAQYMAGLRKSAIVIIPIIIVLLLSLGWIIFRFF